MFEYLIDTAQSRTSKFLLKNRLYCFKQKYFFVRKVFNFSIWIYLIRLAFNAPKILLRVIGYYHCSSLVLHERHYEMISKCAADFHIRLNN
ncbi:hypothetical protein QWZ13_10350 [Reinekea marina]|uniref:hypothetical protein n=1 Tax=Reinekea marina TaxID=1310421 RepID=UPI0025B2A23B|nr:hypothetical protein [Reinekea marina]MDN3649314.1 hypothetical protein [Reinekea marina]